MFTAVCVTLVGKALTDQIGSEFGEVAIQGAAAGSSVHPQHQGVLGRIPLRLHKPETQNASSEEEKSG